MPGYDDLVIRLVLVLWGLLAVLPTAVSAYPTQSVAIVLGADKAATEHLDHYNAARPIDVRVAGDALKFDRLTVTANGPGGIAIRAPLSRTPDGFRGTVRLVTPGTWTLAVTTRLGAFSTNVANVALDVVPPRGVSALAIALFGIATLACAAGALLLASAGARRRFALATIRS